MLNIRTGDATTIEMHNWTRARQRRYGASTGYPPHKLDRVSATPNKDLKGTSEEQAPESLQDHGSLEVRAPKEISIPSDGRFCLDAYSALESSQSKWPLRRGRPMGPLLVLFQFG